MVKGRIKEYLLKYEKTFNKIFHQSLSEYLSKLALFDIPDFDIVKFDSYLHKLGYAEGKHGSMKNYIEQNYGTEATQLICNLIEVEN